MATSFFKRHKDAEYIYFLLFNVAVLAYVSFAFLSDLQATEHASLFFTRCALLFSSFIPLPFLLFSRALTGRRTSRIRALHYAILPLAISALSFSPHAITSVSPNYLGGYSIGQVGWALWLTLAYFLLYFGVSVGLIVAYSKNQIGAKRVALQLILFGVISSVILNMLTQIVLPAFGIGIFGDLLGTPSIIITVGFSAYAIYKKDFFDVKNVAARGIAYLLSISSIMALFALSTFSIGQLIASSTPGEGRIPTVVFYMILASIMAVCFHPLLVLFNRLTDTYFYRDRYDTSTLMSKLSNIMNKQTNVKLLLHDVADELMTSTKARYVYFILTEHHTSTAFLFPQSAKRPVISTHELDTFDSDLTIDDLSALSRTQQDLMRKHAIGCIARLRLKDKNLGYIVLGYKRNGYMYNHQDKSVLETLSSTLAISLENSLSYQKISNFNDTLKVKVAKATKELEKANTKLKELDQAKDEFISMTSHQLRTPLSAVSGYVELLLFKLKRGDKIEDSLELTLKKTLNNARYMGDLVNDLLNISRMDAGKFHIDAESMDIRNLVKKVLDQLEIQASQHEVSLVSELNTANKVMVMLDPEKTRQVMVNLIDNAIQYTPKGTVRVILDETKDKVTFRVVDNGIGVPKAAQKEIFERFYRADNTKKIRPDGTGLGLYMAHRIVEEQGGTMIFESIEGKGSTFGFSVPKPKK